MCVRVRGHSEQKLSDSNASEPTRKSAEKPRKANPKLRNGATSAEPTVEQLNFACFFVRPAKRYGVQWAHVEMEAFGGFLPVFWPMNAQRHRTLRRSRSESSSLHVQNASRCTTHSVRGESVNGCALESFAFGANSSDFVLKSDNKIHVAIKSVTKSNLNIKQYM